jgi:flagellar biosynthesis protein FlhF
MTMKIRSYKGNSLERLYESIQKELGPDAVVVATRKPQGVKGLLPSFLGGESFEVVAVVDDQAADRHLLSAAGGREELKELSRMQTERWKTMEHTVEALQEEIKTLSRSMTTFTCHDDVSMPPFARGWDPRFAGAVRAKHPRFFREMSCDERRRVIAAFLPVEEEFPIKKGNAPHIVALVGPTGSGKTTTMAKLASQWTFEKKLKVGLITTDTFRVAAVDQIKEYATLLGLELRVAFSASEAARAVKSFADRDVILVDTAGRNHQDHASLTALRGMLQGMGAMTVLLLLPAAMDRECACRMIRNYSMLNPGCLVMTKTDESQHLNLLTVAFSEMSCPVAFLTNGQRVPQDIRVARASEIISQMVSEEKET